MSVRHQACFLSIRRPGDYDAAMLDKFAALDKVKEYPWDIRDILPKVLTGWRKRQVR